MFLFLFDQVVPCGPSTHLFLCFPKRLGHAKARQYLTTMTKSIYE